IGLPQHDEGAGELDQLKRAVLDRHAAEHRPEFLSGFQIADGQVQVSLRDTRFAGCSQLRLRGPTTGEGENGDGCRNTKRLDAHVGSFIYLSLPFALLPCSPTSLAIVTAKPRQPDPPPEPERYNSDRKSTRLNS